MADKFLDIEEPLLAHVHDGFSRSIQIHDDDQDDVHVLGDHGSSTAVLRAVGFQPRRCWDDDVQAEGTARSTWDSEPVGDSCRLNVTHDRLREGANEQLFGGWPMILSGLETWLETSELLTTPGSMMYAN